MKKLGIISLSLLAVVSCNKDKVEDKGFEITGTLKNAKDSTLVYLNYGKDIKDSTYVIQEKFSFKGKVEEPESGYLSLKESREYAPLWLENLPITIEAEVGKLTEAKISGSPIQKEANLLKEQLKEVKDKMKKLEDSYNPDMTEEQIEAIYAEADKIKEEEGAILEKFVKDNPKSRVSAQILSVYAGQWGKEKTKGLFEKLSAENKQSSYGKKTEEFITLNNEPAIGDKFVDFEMKDPKGSSHKLSDTKGEIVLLDFWASWCGPCRQENPHVVEAYNTYKDKGFNIFAVSLDEDKAAWEKAIEADKLTWSHVSDLNESGNGNKAAIIYGVNAIPDNFLIDMKTGKVLARGLRGKELQNKLAELLK